MLTLSEAFFVSYMPLGLVVAVFCVVAIKRALGPSDDTQRLNLHMSDKAPFPAKPLRAVDMTKGAPSASERRRGSPGG
jgi:hypothetical protein